MKRIRMTEGVYFIGIRERSGIFKIGVSKDCEKRIKQLQTGNPDNLYIYRIIKTKKPFPVESAIHKYHKDSHYRGEWYKITRHQVDKIDITQKGKNVNVFEKVGWASWVFGGAWSFTKYSYSIVTRTK